MSDDADGFSQAAEEKARQQAEKSPPKGSLAEARNGMAQTRPIN
jgi:hypothetical protein